MDDTVLEGRLVRLEPLGEHHIDGLVAAAADRSAYQWTFVPGNAAEAARYVATARAWQRDGSALPFAIVRREDDRVVGSTRVWNAGPGPRPIPATAAPPPTPARSATPGWRAPPFAPASTPRPRRCC
ncbi:MAG: GNAT family N-acetyltransferase [Pseudomonadota bacterium]